MSKVRGSSGEEIPSVRGLGSGQEEIPHALKPEARVGGWEDQPHSMAVRAQEGREELLHVQGQEGRQ